MRQSTQLTWHAIEMENFHRTKKKKQTEIKKSLQQNSKALKFLCFFFFRVISLSLSASLTGCDWDSSTVNSQTMRIALNTAHTDRYVRSGFHKDW